MPIHRRKTGKQFSRLEPKIHEPASSPNSSRPITRFPLEACRKKAGPLRSPATPPFRMLRKREPRAAAQSPATRCEIDRRRDRQSLSELWTPHGSNVAKLRKVRLIQRWIQSPGQRSVHFIPGGPPDIHNCCPVLKSDWKNEMVFPFPLVHKPLLLPRIFSTSIEDVICDPRNRKLLAARSS